MPSQRPRVLVVEDDYPIRTAVEVALRSSGYEVLALPDGTELIARVEEFRPDLAVLDVRLPVGPGGHDMARVLQSRGGLPLLFLTAADTVEDRLAGFEAGADDYLLKPFAMAELLARVKALLRRSGRALSHVRQVGDLLVDAGARSVVRAGAVLDLTHTEYELLAILAENTGRVLSKHQLLTLVWGFDEYDTNVVEVHMSALRRKLEGHGSRIIHTVRGAGYVLRA